MCHLVDINGQGVLPIKHGPEVNSGWIRQRWLSLVRQQLRVVPPPVLWSHLLFPRRPCLMDFSLSCPLKPHLALYPSQNTKQNTNMLKPPYSEVTSPPAMLSPLLPLLRPSSQLSTLPTPRLSTYALTSQKHSVQVVSWSPPTNCS